MTREEAFELKAAVGRLMYSNNKDIRDYNALIDFIESALRPFSREQVEKVWRGEWIHTHSSDNFWTEVWKCSHCDFEDNYGGCFDFCPFCGRAQTDEAVEIVMERLEELSNGKG